MLTPTLPTDREEDTPDPGVGVDSVAVAFETSEALLFELPRQSLGRNVDRRTGVITDTPGVAMTHARIGLAWGRLVGWRRGGRAWLRVELSLPTMLYGHNRNALAPPLLVDTIDQSLALLSGSYPDIPTVDQTVVQRLDVVRDFVDVQSVHATLSALSRRHIPHARINSPEHSMDGMMQSLVRGSSTQYLVRGYGKQHEMFERAREDQSRRELRRAWAEVSGGRLRFELQLRARLLRSEGLTRVAQLTPLVLDRLARRFFEHARWGGPYGGVGHVQEAMEKLRGQLSSTDYRNLCCYLYCVDRGMAVGLGRHALEHIRPLARKHNLLDRDDDVTLRQLDYDVGREVAGS